MPDNSGGAPYESRPVARRGENAVFVRGGGVGPLLELDHDKIRTGCGVVPRQQHVDPFGTGRNLIFHRHAGIIRNGAVVQGVRHILQRRLPGALFARRRPPAFAPLEIRRQLLDDRAAARVLDKFGLAALVDDHARDRRTETRNENLFRLYDPTTQAEDLASRESACRLLRGHP